MSAIVPFAAGAKLPAYMSNRAALATINDDIVTHAGFPVLSIKGKVFTLVKDGERKVLTRADDPDEVLQSLTLSVVRANTNSRVFYAKAYSEDDAEAAKPDCMSNDGVAPAADARSPQAKKCAVCPHAVWGSKASADGTAGKGTACTVNTRLAVADPESAATAEKLDPYLLRVPAGSRGNFADIIKAAKSRGIPYNALAIKVGFDPTAPAPKLTFKVVGLVDDAVYEKINGLYADETVMDIVGLGAARAALPAPEEAPSVTEADLDTALQAKAAKVTKAAVDKAAAVDPAPAPAPAETPKPAKPAKAAKPAAAPVDASMDNLLGDLDNLLGATDD